MNALNALSSSSTLSLRGRERGRECSPYAYAVTHCTEDSEDSVLKSKSKEIKEINIATTPAAACRVSLPLDVVVTAFLCDDLVQLRLLSFLPLVSSPDMFDPWRWEGRGEDRFRGSEARFTAAEKTSASLPDQEGSNKRHQGDLELADTF